MGGAGMETRLCPCRLRIERTDGRTQRSVCVCVKTIRCVCASFFAAPPRHFSVRIANNNAFYIIRMCHAHLPFFLVCKQTCAHRTNLHFNYNKISTTYLIDELLELVCWLFFYIKYVSALQSHLGRQYLFHKNSKQILCVCACVWIPTWRRRSSRTGMPASLLAFLW